MLQAISITLREGFEAALVIGIMLGYVARTGRHYLRLPIYVGIVAALATSVAGALMLGAIGVDPENKILEGVLYLTAAVFVTSMVVWMWRTGTRVNTQVSDRLAEASGHSLAGTLGVAGFAFFMVAREGIETVLFLAANTLDQGFAPTLIGGSIGLAAAVLLGVAVYLGAARVDMKLFFAATSIALLLLALRFFGVGILELGEGGAFPLSEATEEGLELLEKGYLAAAISTAVIALPIGAIAWSLIRGGGTPTARAA